MNMCIYTHIYNYIYICTYIYLILLYLSVREQNTLFINIPIFRLIHNQLESFSLTTSENLAERIIAINN